MINSANAFNNNSFAGRISVRTAEGSSSNEPIYEKETPKYDEVALNKIKAKLDDPTTGKMNRLTRAIGLGNSLYLYGMDNGLEIKDQSNPYTTVSLTMTLDNVKEDIKALLQSCIEQFKDKVDLSQKDKDDTKFLIEDAIKLADSFEQKIQ